MATMKQRPELIWMAWSAESGFLPQAASVDRTVCREMIKQRLYSNRVKAIRVQVRLPPRKRTA